MVHHLSDIQRERMFENAEIVWTNFAGEQKTFNAAGQQNFCIVLNQQQADELVELGYNVKLTKEKMDPDSNEPLPQTLYLQVDLEWVFKPSRIVMIGDTTRRETTLDQEGAGVLDDMDITMVDVVIRPYDWTVNGKTGTSAKLKSGYFTVHEDFLELKYAALRGDIEPEVAQAVHP